MASKTEELVDKNLSEFEFKDLLKVFTDIFYFSTFIKVIHPIRGKVRFDLYPYQKSVLLQFLKNRFNIILKFRQAGITELISMYCLWLAMYHPNKTVVIISIKDRVAKKVLRKIKYMYKNLPPHLQVRIVNGRRGEYGTAQEIEFANGSTISSIPTTEDAGRSEAVSLLVIDEAAIVRWANQIWAAAFPTLSTGGASIVNSCVTGDTRIIGEHANFRIDSIAPEEFGKKDLSGLNLKVLSHTGKFQKVLGAVNKGKLTTWEVEDNKGNILKCTPAHKLYTTEGWQPVRRIIRKNLNIIQFDAGISHIEPPPITIPPKKEIRKPIKGYPKYMASNLGKVYMKIKGEWVEKEGNINSWGYISLKLWNKGLSKRKLRAHLIVETFIGEIPKGYVVDHIDCSRDNDYVTNLQIITKSDNAKRAIKYSRGLNLNNNTGKGFPNIDIIGKIWEMDSQGKPNMDIASELGINRSYVTRTLNGTRTKGVYISKLKVNRKYKDYIYDISVDQDSSYITDSQYINHNTPYGVGNWYHAQWVNAVAGGNDFAAIRLYWQMHPERNQQWYDSMRESLGPRRTAQEIDGDFLTSGHTVFDLADIKGIEDTLTENKPISVRMNGDLRIYERPNKKSLYYIGSDVATGRSRDYSAFSIMDRLGEEVAAFKGKISTDKLADLLNEMGLEYNRALVAPESNDIGLAVTNKLQTLNYPNLYYSTKLLKEKGKRHPKKEKIPGWLTTSKNRPVIIDELEQDIRNEEVIIKDPFFVQEAYTFIYDETNRPVALGKNKRSSGDAGELDEQTYTDDSILAKSITNFIRKGKKKNTVIAPM